MLLIRPKYKILYSQPNILQTLEEIGRVCYKSEEKITPNSYSNFIKKIIKSGHHSVIEHANITIKFICDRGVSHELIRHRLASFSQESTRYCNYKNKVTFIIPPWINLKEGRYFADYIDTKGTDREASTWFHAMKYAKDSYLTLLNFGHSPQQARAVLPNSLKTEIIMTANIREWRHIFKLRTAKAAHPQMRELMMPLLEELREKAPVIFDNL